VKPEVDFPQERSVLSLFVSALVFVHNMLYLVPLFLILLSLSALIFLLPAPLADLLYVALFHNLLSVSNSSVAVSTVVRPVHANNSAFS